MRTERQRLGDAAEEIVAVRLAAQGWTVLARQLRVGRRELDIVAVDPGPPRTLVIVEVRWRASRAFGLPEETVDWRKRRGLVLATELLRQRGLPGVDWLVALPFRVDLVVVERPAGGPGPVRVRHHRYAVSD